MKRPSKSVKKLNRNYIVKCCGFKKCFSPDSKGVNSSSAVGGRKNPKSKGGRANDEENSPKKINSRPGEKGSDRDLKHKNGADSSKKLVRIFIREPIKYNITKLHISS